MSYHIRLSLIAILCAAQPSINAAFRAPQALSKALPRRTLLCAGAYFFASSNHSHNSYNGQPRAIINNPLALGKSLQPSTVDRNNLLRTAGAIFLSFLEKPIGPEEPNLSPDFKITTATNIYRGTHGLQSYVAALKSTIRSWENPTVCIAPHDRSSTVTLSLQAAIDNETASKPSPITIILTVDDSGQVLAITEKIMS